MAFNTDGLSKRVWLVNGFLLLAALVVILLLVAYAIVGERVFGGQQVAVRAEPAAKQSEGSVRAVRFGQPEEIRGTDTRLVEVRHGRGEVREEGYNLGSTRAYDGWRDGPLVNVLFLDAKSDAGRLLLDRAAFIDAIDAPRHNADSLRQLIAYRIVFTDSNGDGELSGEDAAELWVSDVDGRGLRRASPEGVIVRGHTFLENGRQILILAVQRPPSGRRDVGEEQMPQRSFLYDAASQTTRSLTALDSLALTAGRLVSGR